MTQSEFEFDGVEEKRRSLVLLTSGRRYRFR